MILTEIVWNVKPEIFRLDWFAVRWYGLFFAAAFYFGYLIIDKFFKNENIADSVLDKLTIYMAVGTIVGARLGHCLFYQPEVYLPNPIEILKIWEGGLASHGAAVGILFSLWLFSKKTNTGYLWIVDRIVVVVALSGLFIRMGNLMNSEIYGHPTTLPWGFTFVRDIETFKNAAGQAIPCHPTQIYEALAYFAIFGFLLNYYWKHKGIVREGFMTGFFLITLFSVRFLVEFLKNNQVGFESSMILNMGQLLSIPFIIIGIYLVYKSSKATIKE